MSTPYATHLHGIESWSTDQIEYSHEDLTKVSASLTAIAKTNRSIASDLGLEGSTARAACACFDSLATHLFDHVKKIDQIVKVSTDVMNAGIDARNTSAEIQKRLKQANATFGTVGTANNNVSTPDAAAAAAQVQVKRDAAYAEIEKRAKQALHTLDAKALAGISQLPFQDEIRQAAAGPDSPEAKPRMITTSPEQTSPATHTTAGGAQKSATAWTVTPDRSIDSPGSQPDVFLQANHHTPPPGGVSAPGSLTTTTPGSSASGSSVSGGTGGSILHSPAVHNTLATAAAISGATTIAGYKAYQAARAAQRLQAKSTSLAGRSGAAIRTGPARTASIVRGTTTAIRTPTTATTGRGTTRGGATGIARPTSTTTPRTNGILRGTTTAIRARTPTATTRPSIVRGATTAIRRPTTEQTTTRGTSRTTTASRTTGSTAARGSTSRTGSTNTGRASAPRATGSTARRTGRTSINNSTRSFSRPSTTSQAADTNRATATNRSTTTTARAGSPSSSKSTRSSQPRESSASQALSRLTGRPDKNKRRNTDHTADHTPVTAYRDDKTVTFLEAGHTPTAHTPSTPK